MKKLTKIQTILLVVIGVVILIGFGVVNFVQINKKSGAKEKSSSSETSQMPDPGAEVRKQYEDTKKKGVAEKKSSTKKGSLLDESTMSKPKPKSTNKDVTKDDRGEISGVVPTGSILTEAPVEVAPAPTIAVPQEDKGGKIAETPVTRINTSNITPSIPTGLLDQTPPEQAQRSQQALIPAQVRTKPGRYLFNNLTDDSLRSPAIKFQSGGPSYSLDKFAPQGEFIDIVFMHNAASNQSEVPITVAVWTPFYFQGHKILDTGDKILGRATQGKRGRLMASFDKVIFKSGKSTPISALALDTDGTAGIEGYVVGDRLVQQIGVIAMETAGEFLDKLSSRATENQNQVVYNFSNNNQTDASDDFKGAMGSAMKKATQRIQEAMKEEFEDQKPYVLVPAGTRARAYLLTPFDPSNADYGK